jgi:hypothetical protein
MKITNHYCKLYPPFHNNSKLKFPIDTQQLTKKTLNEKFKNLWKKNKKLNIHNYYFLNSQPWTKHYHNKKMINSWKNSKKSLKFANKKKRKFLLYLFM